MGCAPATLRSTERAHRAVLPFRKRAQQLLDHVRVTLGGRLEESPTSTQLFHRNIVQLDTPTVKVCQQLPIAIAGGERRATVPARGRSAATAPQNWLLSESHVVLVAVEDVGYVDPTQERARRDCGPGQAHDGRQKVDRGPKRCMSEYVWEPQKICQLHGSQPWPPFSALHAAVAGNSHVSWNGNVSLYCSGRGSIVSCDMCHHRLM
eukprot:m.292398 g.292398  ORF g.292398 m.292398 type:complete len:207 (-) comp27121_c1_seq79:776-1396(-)